MGANNFKLLKNKNCRVLTWSSKLLITLTLAATIIAFTKTIPFFLSVHKPLNGDVLLLDGQMPDYAIEEAIKIFNKGNYEFIVTTGGRIASGYYIADIKTMAELNKATFLRLGFPKNKTIALPTGNFVTNRTYHSALTSKKWLLKNNTSFRKVDILAIGAHARRSRLLFKKALGEDFEVGIIRVKHPGYHSSIWWKSSIGSRVIISETIAFTYAKLFFKAP